MEPKIEYRVLLGSHLKQTSKNYLFKVIIKIETWAFICEIFQLIERIFWKVTVVWGKKLILSYLESQDSNSQNFNAAFIN